MLANAAQGGRPIKSGSPPKPARISPRLNIDETQTSMERILASRNGPSLNVRFRAMRGAAMGRWTPRHRRRVTGLRSATALRAQMPAVRCSWAVRIVTAFVSPAGCRHWPTLFRRTVLTLVAAVQLGRLADGCAEMHANARSCAD